MTSKYSGYNYYKKRIKKAKYDYKIGSISELMKLCAVYNIKCPSHPTVLRVLKGASLKEKEELGLIIENQEGYHVCVFLKEFNNIKYSLSELFEKSQKTNGRPFGSKNKPYENN